MRQMAIVVTDSDALDAFMDRVEQCFAWADAQEHFATAGLAALDECAASLPERSRHLLSLKYTQRTAMERIVDETGQSFEAVKNALILRLRDHIDATILDHFTTQPPQCQTHQQTPTS
jgi:hypothetical protein